MEIQKLLLIIGVLGIIASVIGVVRKLDVTTNLIGFICGTCLIYGYIELKKVKNEQAKSN